MSSICYKLKHRKLKLNPSPSFQVNYFKDHTKLIIGKLDEPLVPSASGGLAPPPPSNTDFIVTYINSARESRSYDLADIARHGTSQAVRERMNYVASVLDEFVELDKQIS